jgi:hypothetical protein
LLYPTELLAHLLPVGFENVETLPQFGKKVKMAGKEA